MVNIDKLNSIATNSSNWLEEAKTRQKNKGWLKHSQKIAIKVLRTLREKNIKQKEFASMIGVSPQQVNKIVMGNENLTLDTISKLEMALDVKLIFPENKQQSSTKEFIVKKQIVYLHVYTNKEEVAKQKTSYKIRNEYFSQTELNEICVNYG